MSPFSQPDLAAHETQKESQHMTLLFSSDPVGIQTQDLQNRNLTLYSAKLRDLCTCLLVSKRMQRYKISFKSTTNLLLFILSKQRHEL